MGDSPSKSKVMFSKTFLAKTDPKAGKLAKKMPVLRK